MKKLSPMPGLLLVFLAGSSLFPDTSPQAQVYKSYKSNTSFFSDAPLEDIEAHNGAGASVFNTSSGEIVFLIPIRKFQFRKSLMQEHFNENYMESDKYPNATFKGKILNYNGLSDGRQEVEAEGLLTIHGVEKQVKVGGTLEKNGEDVRLASTFGVALADYNIRIPRLVVRNIAEEVEVSIEYFYKANAQ